MESHEKFTGKASIYKKHRPNYPGEYIDHLAKYNYLGAQSVIADIGSGTGILSKQLLDKGFKVACVEPNGDMRSAAEAELKDYPGFSSVNGTAEHTGLAGNSVSLITAAQAFHWFDKELFKAECRRVLKQGANVALVWKQPGRKQPACKGECENYETLLPAVQRLRRRYRRDAGRI